MTVIEAIRRSAEFLEKRGVDSPRLQAELMLARTLGLPRMKLYLDFERELSAGELDALREMVRRRGLREPLQHILGTTSFCGLELKVTGDVLVPRPETEQLAELGWECLKSFAPPGGAEVEEAMALRERPPEWEGSGLTALDFGTGSGCLAIALAVKVPSARVVAVDISEPALAVARENAARHGVVERVRFLHGDGFAAVPSGMRFDVIVSNPPYVPSAEIDALEPEVREHDPRLALNGGAEGLDFYRLLAERGAGALKPDGRMMVEFGDGQAAAVQEMFERQNWIVERVQPDYSGRSRFLVARTA